MTLQSSSDGGTTWKNVKGKTITMNGFRSEIQEKEATASVPQYDEFGNPVDESFPYDVEVSGSGYVSKSDPVAHVDITNSVKDKVKEPTVTPEPTKVPTETPTVSPEPTETPVPTETPMPTATITETPGNETPGSGNTPGSSGSSNVKTGDDTQTEPFVLLILISGCALIFVSRKKRKSA